MFDFNKLPSLDKIAPHLAATLRLRGFFRKQFPALFALQEKVTKEEARKRTIQSSIRTRIGNLIFLIRHRHDDE